MKKINIPDGVYLTFADLLAFNICGKTHVCDEISVVEGDIVFTLRGNFVAYYEPSRDEERFGREVLVDITPIWWDFEAVEGVEKYDTDFSFDELKNYMLC